MKTNDYSVIYFNAKSQGFKYVGILFEGEGWNCRANCVGSFNINLKSKSAAIKRVKRMVKDQSESGTYNGKVHIEVFDTTCGAVVWSTPSF